MRAGILVLAPLLVTAAFAAPLEAGPDRFGVTFVPAVAARAQIQTASEAEGIALADYARNANHSVLMVRRTKPGHAEVHTALTDVWYVIDGSGTLVTGGKAVDDNMVAPGEFRGSGVSGGIARHIGKGDIVDIPAGVPHWVSKVDGKELVYLTVKVSTPKR